MGYMFKDHKKIWVVIAVLFVISSCFVLKKMFRKQEDSCSLYLTLDGNRIVHLKLGEKYEEDGYHAVSSCQKDYNDQVEIVDHVNYQVPGTYERVYSLKLENGEELTETRFIVLTVEEKITYKDTYDAIDNQVKGWGIPNKKDGQRPVEAGSVREQLLAYDAYLIGNDEKVLYLTFDEGSNDTYLKEIVQVLNDNDVKATFFFCKNFILNNPELMKTLVETGHSVGNHTANHYQMPKYANRSSFQTYLKEIIAVEEAFKSVTGVDIDPVYREPKGEYSLRSLQIMKDLGYKTYFWSVAYLDYKEDVSKEKALAELTSRVHNGAIYLIHPKNKGNYEAMDAFIKQMKSEGYTFDLVKNISS